MTNALQSLPDSINQYVLFPEVDDCLCAFRIEVVDDIGALVKYRVGKVGSEPQVFVSRQFLIKSKEAIMLPVFLLRKGHLEQYRYWKPVPFDPADCLARGRIGHKSQSGLQPIRLPHR